MNDLSLQPARSLLEACPLGILVIGADGRIRWMNETLARLLQVRRDELIGRTPEEMPREDLKGLFSWRGPLRVVPGDGSGRWLSVRHARVETGDGAQEVRFFLYTTLQERDREGDADHAWEPWRQTITEPRTGLLNLRALMLVVEPQVARSRRYNQPLSLVVMRIPLDPGPPRRRADTLAAVSGMLRDQLRWADLIGITDDDDFVLVLPETRREDAAKLVEKLEARLSGLTLGDGRTLSLAGRFGIAEWRRGDNAAALLRRATDALGS